MNSYMVGIKTSFDEEWVWNGLRFKLYADAHAYAVGLKLRWTQVKEYFVAGCDDPPNATFPVPNDRYITKLREGREEL